MIFHQLRRDYGHDNPNASANENGNGNGNESVNGVCHYHSNANGI